MSTPNTTALNNYAGTYEKELYATAINNLDVAKDITVVPGIKNKETRTKLVVAPGARPYREQKDVSDDDLQYIPRVLETNLNKRDITINPLKYRAGYQSEVMSAGINPSEIPFAKYVWDRVLAEFFAEVNDVAAYSGTGYNPAGSGAIDMAKGIGTLIAEEITATNLTPVVTGAITAADAYDQFVEVHRSLPVPIKKDMHHIYCSHNSFELLMDSYEDKVGKYTIKDVSNDTVVGIYLPKTMNKCIVKPASWMGNSGRLIATPKANLEMGVDSEQARLITDVELELITGRILYAFGFQIRDLDAMVVNDQA